MLYTIYLPKKKGATENSVTEWIKKYDKITNHRNHIIMSPGYMSQSKSTIEYFIDQLSNTRAGNPLRIGILNGMNGSRRLNDDKKKAILSHHEDYIRLNPNTLWLPLKSNGKTDHRKIMAFYTFEKGYDEKCICNENDIDDFLSCISVHAILIGSSNQSKNTYYEKVASKGEADVFMTTTDIYSHEKSEDLHALLRSIAREFSFSDNLQIDNARDIDECAEFLQKNCSVSKSFAGQGHDNPSEFLKSILKNVLIDGIL